MVWCAMAVIPTCWLHHPAHAALPTPAGKKVITPEDLGVMHARVADATSPSTVWHVFARCLTDTMGELHMYAFVLRQTRNSTVGLLGFPRGVSDDFLQLGRGSRWVVLEGAARVQHPGLHPAHIRAGPLRNAGDYVLKIQVGVYVWGVDENWSKHACTTWPLYVQQPSL